LTNALGTPRAVTALIDGQGRRVALDGLLTQRSARWLIDDTERAHHAAQHDALAHALDSGSLHLQLDDGQTLAFAAQPHGAAGLGAPFWLAAMLALLLYVVAVAALLGRPEPRHWLYAVMAMTQVGNLLFLAAESLTTLGLPAGFMRWDHDLRAALDLAASAALVHASGSYPRPLANARIRTSVAWFAITALVVGVSSHGLANTWWWTQAAMVGCGALAVAQLGWMQRAQPDPLAALLQRFCAVSTGTLLILTLSIAAVGPQIGSGGQVEAIGAAVWYVSTAAMLLLLPFVARTRLLMREFALLAGVSVVATSLDLLFARIFEFGDLASLMLALFVALGLYAGLRQWLLHQAMAHERRTTERLLEHLFRVARELQARPQSVGEQVSHLLRELFEPLEALHLPRHGNRARIADNGARLLVPVPQLAPSTPPSVIMLGFAQRGLRMFTAEDARLAERVVEQLLRAVAFDQAVERGRSEERLRIAQDLHDDIGARLLTLMYRAPTPEIEDYLRHTLKDLKTLTRGLAAPSHALSHAIAEWKADITQRVSAADCELGWAFVYESDFELSVVQWSALTRVLRELVSNALTHAHAHRIDVQASIGNGALVLSVADDGDGRHPDSWSHGLGLGGVRKRVRQIGGEVSWHENGERGIVCKVAVPAFTPV